MQKLKKKKKERKERKKAVKALTTADVAGDSGSYPASFYFFLGSPVKAVREQHCTMPFQITSTTPSFLTYSLSHHSSTPICPFANVIHYLLQNCLLVRLLNEGLG